MGCGAVSAMHLHGATAQSVGALRLVLGADYKLKKDGPKVQATQRVLFLNLPRLLIMHLSRFTYDVSTGNSKVHKRVHFDAKLSCAFPHVIILAMKVSGRLHLLMRLGHSCGVIMLLPSAYQPA